MYTSIHGICGRECFNSLHTLLMEVLILREGGREGGKEGGGREGGRDRGREGGDGGEGGREGGTEGRREGGREGKKEGGRREGGRRFMLISRLFPTIPSMYMSLVCTCLWYVCR